MCTEAKAEGVVVSRVLNICIDVKLPPWRHRTGHPSHGFCARSTPVAGALRRQSWRLALPVLLVALAHAPAAGQCLDYTLFPNVRDRLAGDGAVLVDGTYAYTGHLSRLLVHDLSTSPGATQVAELDLGSGAIHSMARVGDFLYVATAAREIALILVTDPTAPIRIPSVGLSGVADHIVAAGNRRLYMVERRATAPFYHFSIFDTSFPTSPTPLGSTTLPFAGAGLAIVDNHAYVAMTNGGFQVIEISTPSLPMKRGAFSAPGIYARDVVVRENLAYVTSSEGDIGLYVLDVSSPVQPEQLGSMALDGGGWGIALANDTAYVAAGAAEGLAVVDLSEPLAPRVAETITVRSFATDLEVTAERVFVGCQNGVFAIRAPAANSPPVIGAAATPGEASFVVPVGNLALVMDGEAGMHVMDVADPAAPSIVGSVDTPGYAARAAVSGSHAFLATGERGRGGLVVVDFSVPSSPRVVTELNPPDPAVDVVVNGSVAYVAALNELHVVDVSIPSASAIVGSASMREGAVGVALHETYAYVAERTAGVSIVDVSDPGAPRVVGAILDADNAVGVQVADGRLYIANFLSSGPDLLIMDLADPLAPARLGSLELRTSSFAQFHVDADWLYTNDGFHVVDVSDAASPQTVAGAVHLPGFPKAVSVDAEHVYLATGTGLEIRAKQCDVLTSVVLDGLRAVVEAAGIRLRWSTPGGSFHEWDVLRQERGPAAQTGNTAAYALLASRPQDTGSRSSWEFLDTDVIAGRTYAYKIRGHARDGRMQEFGPVLATVHAAGTPFRLHPIRPNPAAGAALVRYELPRPEPIELQVFDVSGRRVRRLFHGAANPGLHVVRWNGLDARGRPAPSGVYFVHYSWAQGTMTERLTLLR